MLSLLCALALAAPDHVPHIGDVVLVPYGADGYIKSMVLSHYLDVEGNVLNIHLNWDLQYDATILPDYIVILSCICDSAEASPACNEEPINLGEALSASPSPRPQPRPR